MPIYEYKCAACGVHVEKMQKISDSPPVCEKCGGQMEKQVSRSGFQFKGSGWYVTDYAGKKGETKSEAGESGKSEAKTEKTSPPESTAKPDAASKPKETKSSE